MSLHPIASVKVRWLSKDEGGRTAPPPGPVFATTAHFAGQSLDTLFSIVLRTPRPSPLGFHDAGLLDLTLLAPENVPEVVNNLQPGRNLVITEGARRVADCRIVSVRQEPLENAKRGLES
jgi:hypothetical protein